MCSSIREICVTGGNSVSYEELEEVNEEGFYYFRDWTKTQRYISDDTNDLFDEYSLEASTGLDSFELINIFMDG